ncbi:undecaprenyl-diphosphate phosphatase [Salarchaeum sp. JOR-1]|uniref:undecaprenyl-diphosphate phosphatase n=1 Tax=Salarchaeum sp. JOR-1 TaxID=2599399 RepID=UPI00197F137A|nr:undecaprenyl-diphosphate phosphatase [Salarchaeum sp. JOR-1]
MDRELLVALAAGILQGIFEWLPISSEGNITIVLSALGRAPEQVVAFALFLHLGTALSATAYYHDELAAILTRLPAWRPHRAFDGEQAIVTFLGIGTLVSGVVGITAYVTLIDAFSTLTGGVFIALVGVLLVGTGVFQYLAEDIVGDRKTPGWRDAILVGIAQGLAILPGISRSGMTTGTLLLRGHNGPQSFRFSFLLAIPASVGGSLLAYLDTGISVSLVAAAIALGAAAIVGYATIDALLRIVETLPFWSVCIALGTLAALGGLLVM